MLRITIILPFPVTKPVGGAKIMYEYANHFSARGHRVTILHSLRRPFKKMKSPIWWKRFVFFLQRAKRPRWFPLSSEVDSRIVDEINDTLVPDGDLIFSTWWQMAYAIEKLAPVKGIPVNLVQDYEDWGGQESKLLASFRLPIHQAAIARWLQEKIAIESKRMVKLLPNAIDTNRFLLTRPVDSRSPLSVLALYSEEKRKGTVYAIETAVLLKQQYPDLLWTFFGVYPRPKLLPDWIQYFQRPSHLSALYNEHAIFFSSSLGEGWALPPAEAMACGCAVACTNIGGHVDYAMHEQTALLFPVKNTKAMVEQVSRLLQQGSFRIQLALAGHQFLLSNFNWGHSVDTALQWFEELQKE